MCLCCERLGSGELLYFPSSTSLSILIEKPKLKRECFEISKGVVITENWKGGRLSTFLCAFKGIFCLKNNQDYALVSGVHPW